ncbi:MAG: YncE family protein, partial [Candidatus Binataceae bacterium]
MRSVNLRTIALWIVLLAAIPLAGLRWSIRPLPARADQATTISLPLPGGEAGIGLDDLGFAPSIGKVLVPAGRTGLLDLIDPDTKSIASIGGFSSSDAFAHGHGEGITSADYGRGLLFVTDRTVKRLSVVDPNRRSIVASAPLATEPDYVRFVSDTSEVWVTEPSAQRIEIFRLPRAETPQPVHAAFIAVPGGPESLVIDH